MHKRESRLRQLTRSIENSAMTLRPLAEKDFSLQSTYNSLCDALDALNGKLALEGEGSLPCTWRRL